MKLFTFLGSFLKQEKKAPVQVGKNPSLTKELVGFLRKKFHRQLHFLYDEKTIQIVDRRLQTEILMIKIENGRLIFIEKGRREPFSVPLTEDGIEDFKIKVTETLARLQNISSPPQ